MLAVMNLIMETAGNCITTISHLQVFGIFWVFLCFLLISTLQVVDGYFVHYFAPSGLAPLSKNVMFILDVSGSMSGFKLQQVIGFFVCNIKNLLCLRPL